MDEKLDPKEIARIKKLARSARITRIRRRTAVTAATLATLFSGAILARTQLDQTGQPGGAQTVLVSRTEPVTGSDPEAENGSGDEHGVLSAIVETATGVINGSDTPTASQSVSPSPPTQPLTTSQS